MLPVRWRVNERNDKRDVSWYWQTLSYSRGYATGSLLRDRNAMYRKQTVSRLMNCGMQGDAVNIRTFAALKAP
jgi:hypothetical protein